MGKSIAIITARGGSKRIPHKNIRDFCGKPIISYSIETAKKSGIFDRVMVSTDSDEIAAVAREYGAEVPFMRSAENSDDYSTTEDVMLEVLGSYSKIGEQYDVACCLYPTAVFVTPEILKESMRVMTEKNPDVVIPLVQFSYPPQRGMIINPNGYAELINHEHVRTRSQDLEKIYHDCGQFYLYNVKRLIETKGYITNTFAPVVIPEMFVQDIDCEEDWKMAELKYKMINKIS